MHVSALPASVTDSASDTLTDPMLSSLDGVRVSYAGSVAALDEVSLLFARGEQVAIIGPSGAGKTTLLHTLGCAIRPTAARAGGRGRDPRAVACKKRPRRRRETFIAARTPPASSTTRLG